MGIPALWIIIGILILIVCIFFAFTNRELKHKNKYAAYILSNLGIIFLVPAVA